MSKELLDRVPGEIKSALLGLYGSPAWPYHAQMGEELIQSIKRELEALSDPVMIYRAQGKIEGIRLLLGLKDSLNPKQPSRFPGGY